MKIFYGIQGTGNGHITRGRVMAKELYEAGFDVTFQFTGRSKDKFFDMEVFNGYQHREGLTFNTDNSQVNYIKTTLQSSPIRFVKDVKNLDLSSYDLIISDFEPVTAWAGKIQKKTVLGLGHQYAFNHDIPRTGSDPLANLVIKYFAPVAKGIGLHWHHFDQPILPPIIETYKIPDYTEKNKIVVYLPIEDQAKVIQLLSPYKDYQFHLYSPVPIECSFDHIICNPLSRDGFQKDLFDCQGVFSNAGFELASESLQLGKKILAKPLHAQMEQLSNVTALKQLGYGQTMMNMDSSVIESWLEQDHATRITYPNVAKLIANWIQQDMPEMDSAFIKQIWDEVEILQIRL